VVDEAEQFAEEDRKVKERIDSKNSLEFYVFNLKNTLEDSDLGAADNISSEDMKDIQDATDEALDWMEENPEAAKEDYNGKQKELEQIAMPVMRSIYSNTAEGEDTDDFGDDNIKSIC